METAHSLTWSDKLLFLLGFSTATLFFLWAGMLSGSSTIVGVEQADAGQDFGVNLTVRGVPIEPITGSYDIILQSSDGNIVCSLEYQGSTLLRSSGSCAHHYYYPTAGQALSASIQSDEIPGLFLHGWQCTATTADDSFTLGNSSNLTSINVPFVTSEYALLPASQEGSRIDCAFSFEDAFDFTLDGVLDGDQIFTVMRGDSLSIPFSFDLLYTNSAVKFELQESPPFTTSFQFPVCSQDCFNDLRIQTTDTTPLGTYDLTILGVWPPNSPDDTPYLVKDLPVTVRVIDKPRRSSAPTITPVPTPRR